MFLGHQVLLSPRVSRPVLLSARCFSQPNWPTALADLSSGSGIRFCTAERSGGQVERIELVAGCGLGVLD
jgi:hypothetical protein